LVAVLVSGFLLGMVFAWSAADEQKLGRSPLQSEAAWVVLAFGIVVFGPSAGTLVSFHGDWSLSFWWPVEALPAPVLAFSVLCCALAPLVGFSMGVALLRRRQPLVLLYVAAAALLGCAGASLFILPRLLVEASYLEFHSGIGGGFGGVGFGARPIAGSALGYSLLWMSALVSGVSVWTAQALRRWPQRHPEPFETHLPGRTLRPSSRVGDR
jgi:hypothetical protein